MANINAQFNYSANFGPVIGQMQKLTAEANLLNNTLQNLDKQAVGLKTSLAASFASDLGKIGGWNAKMIELTDSVDQFGQSLLKQKLTLKQYAQEAIGAFTKSSNAHKLAVREVAREMSQLVTLGKGMDGKQMGMMITPATINLKDFNTQLAVSQKQWSIFNSLVQDGTTHLINFGKNTQWAGRQITVGLTVPLTIYGNTVSKIFREVDAELTRFQKVYGSDLMNSTSNATQQMVNDVRNLAVEFSKSFGIAAKETASLAADLAATGLEGQKLLASLRETTRLAVLGDVSNQDAMKTTLSLQNAFKVSTDELANSVNFLNAVENQTSLSLQDLTTAIPKAGPVVKSLGGDVKDLSLLMVALKEGGISAAEGANALKSGMASLINPTKQASLTAKQYGIDINGIVQANRGQLMPTIIAFQQQLQLLDDFGKAQVIENVFGKYQFARISALFDNLNASASQTNAVLALMGKSNRELAATAYQEMDTLMNSSSKRFQRAVEGIKAQFITIGESITTSIIPILENVTGKIGKAIEFFQNLPKPVKSFIKVATGLTAIAGPIIMMVGIFSNFLGYIGKGAMGMVNLGRRMAGIPTQKFEMLTDTQIMAQRATEQLANSFDVERSSVERLNQALGLYRQNLVEAINLNPAFLNRQIASAPRPAAITGIDVATPKAKLQSGGSAWVPGSGDGDKVPAMLEPGEYVVNKKAAAKYSGALDQMNFQSAPRFQMGGRMPGYADQSFIGPLPQISYNVQGTYRPGGYTPFANYPFASKESAESFQSTDPRKWGGSGSRITRDINDPQQKAYADWIEGHNSNQFRTGTGVMKRTDMEGHREQMLNSMGPISANIPLFRGTVLREKGANEFSGVGARELLMYIKYGMFDKAMGKKIQWSDLQSFSSNPNIASYSKFIESWTNPSNTNSKKAADRQLASMEMLPVIFRLASAQGQTGFNISDKAMVQEVMGKPVNEKEWVLNKPSGTITGIRQDMGTRNYIIDLMQNGGRVQSHADESKELAEWTSGGMKGVRSNLYKYQALTNQASSIPAGIRLGRGTVLNPGLSKELSAEQQMMLLAAIQSGDYSSVIGKELSFRGLNSFSESSIGAKYSPTNNYPISRFMDNALAPYSAVGQSGSLAKAVASGLKVGPAGYSGAFFDFTTGKNTKGINAGLRSMNQLQETILSSPSGRITGVSSDTTTKKPIFHIQGYQSGGRIKSAASGMAFAHIVPPVQKGVGIMATYPLGLNIPKELNSSLNQTTPTVDKNILARAFSSPSSTVEMQKLFGAFNSKNPNSGINAGMANQIRDEELRTLTDAPKLLNDKLLYKESLQSGLIKNVYQKFINAEYLRDYRANISEETLLEQGFKYNKQGYLTSPDGNIVMKKVMKNGGKYKWQQVGTGKTLGRNSFTSKQRSITQGNPLFDYLMHPSRLASHATETATWAKKAAAPKAYAGVLQGIPNWATRDAEYQAIVSALQGAGVPESDRLASYYIQDVLAHINPSTTNANGVYEKVWAAANLMKDSQVYNVFLETLNSRKDIGGLLNPSTVSRVASASGLPMPVVQAELTKIADGVHPNTANGARVMMTLARMFPSRTSPGMPIAVAAGMGARLQGDFYDTLGQRALPSNLPNITVRSYDPKGGGAPTSTGQGSRVRSTGLIMPSGAIKPSIVMPNIQSIPSAAGGTGTSATVKVDGMGNVLSNGIDDMVANTITGQPIAVSSKELLAIGPNGGIAGVTSPGDEARGKIVHPMGTALMRGKKFQEKRLRGFATTSAISGLDIMPDKPVQNTQPVYEQPISPGSMGQFGGNAFMMISVMQQMSFAMSQFTSETQNGTAKIVAGMNLFLTASQAMSGQVGEILGNMANARKASGQIGPGGVPLDNRGKPITGISSGIGRAMGGVANVATKLGTFPVQIGLQIGIMAVNKGIQLYQKEMAKAREAGNGAFKEPTESAKLLGVELKSLTADAERYAKFAQNLFGSQGRGAYDKVFAETIKKDYGDFLEILAQTKTTQEQINQITSVYGNLIQRGMDPKVALELTAEIARQGKAMTAFNQASQNFGLKDTVGDVMKMQTDALESQIELLNQRNEAASGSSDTANKLRSNAFADYLGLSDSGIEGLIRKNLGGDMSSIGGFFGKMLISNTVKTQLAAQIGATLKASFAIAAQDPVASNEAVDAIVSNFKNVDTSKIQEEVGKLAEEFGFGDLTNTGMFIDTGAFTNLGAESQTLFLNALKSGLGPQLDKMLADGNLSAEERSALEQKVLEAQAIMKIDVEVDLQLDETTKQLEAVQEELNRVYDIALRGKQEEIAAEDIRHEKAMKNLDNESQRLNDKKELLRRNTDYYIKELQREKAAEDYYANQRDIGLQGLTAISQGDVFGFIGAQMRAASSADQFGRDRSLAAIQETSDAAQQKLDDDLKAIDARRQAESERHTAEIANINLEIEALNKKKAAASSDIQSAIKLLQEAKALQPSSDPQDQKIYNEKIAQAYQLAGGAIDQAKAAAGFVDKTGLSKDLQKEMDDAQAKTKKALDAFYADTDTAMQYIANGGEKGWDIVLSGMSDASKKIFNDVAKSLDIDAKTPEFVGAANFLATAINSGTQMTANGNRIITLSNNPTLRASGGYISGPGTGTSDSIPAMLSNGEYVINASAVKAYGPKLMDKINTKKFAYGGMVGSMPGMSSAPGMATGGFAGSMPSPSSAPGMAAGGFIGNSAPSFPKYNIPSAGGGMAPAPIAQMARGGMMSGSASDNSSSYNFNFNGAGMDMVMSHVNKAVGGRISSNSRRIG